MSCRYNWHYLIRWRQSQFLRSKYGKKRVVDYQYPEPTERKLAEHKVDLNRVSKSAVYALGNNVVGVLNARNQEAPWIDIERPEQGTDIILSMYTDEGLKLWPWTYVVSSEVAYRSFWYENVENVESFRSADI